MSWKKRSVHFLLATSILVVAACQDAPSPTAPQDETPGVHAAHQAPHAPQEVAAWFARSSPEVLALPGTVFADHDEEANRLVFGIENRGVARAVENALSRLEIPSSAYTIQVTEPIRFMNTTLRTAHRPTVGGVQIHFSSWVCTLGFNVAHAAGRSFITNSHCTDNQGSSGNTAYYQPSSSVDGTPIAFEADDPSFFRGQGVCPRGRVCRYSDAARALYQSGTESSQGMIAKTTGLNSGSLNVAGSLTVNSQDNSSTSFSGTLHKVGRTTGWTSGTVTNTCATVNVFGSNITLLCQTLVQGSGNVVGGGDSGSPVFRPPTGSDNVELVGILWGGSGSSLFVFSPLKNIQDELGAMTATATGDPPPPDNGDDDSGGEGGGGNSCPPGKAKKGEC